MLLAALLFAVQTAPTDPLQPPNQTLMAEPVALFLAACDANGDAQVTKAEATACVARTFAAADTDHKGSIGYIQFADWSLAWLGDRNALPSPFEVDTDHDDRITLAELTANVLGTFDRLDRDHDGVLTRAELLTIRNGADPGSGRHRRDR